jgi:transcriptional regulator with XRE-family HTH domain
MMVRYDGGRPPIPPGPAGPSFFGRKLRIARTFQGLAQGELAQQAGVSAATVRLVECGARVPEETLARALGEALGFEPAFFASPFADEVREDELFADEGAAAVPAAVTVRAALLAELVAWLDARVRFPEERLPAEARGGDAEAVEAAAAECRRLWQLAPDLPIPSLSRVLERAGLLVVRAAGSGFSRAGRRILVALDEARSPEDARVALARAAGHAVLHRGSDADLETIARDADRFARALLLPRAGFAREVPRRLDADVVARLAQRWRVGAAVIAARVEDLRSTPALVTMGPQAAPNPALPAAAPRLASPLPPEPPEALALAFARLDRGRAIAPRDVARRLGWPVTALAQLTGLAIVSAPRANVVSLAAWRSRHGSAPAAVDAWGLSRTTAPSEGPDRGPQLELDFGPR